MCDKNDTNIDYSDWRRSKKAGENVENFQKFLEKMRRKKGPKKGQKRQKKSRKRKKREKKEEKKKPRRFYFSKFSFPSVITVFTANTRVYRFYPRYFPAFASLLWFYSGLALNFPNLRVLHCLLFFLSNLLSPLFSHLSSSNSQSCRFQIRPELFELLLFENFLTKRYIFDTKLKKQTSWEQNYGHISRL